MNLPDSGTPVPGDTLDRADWTPESFQQLVTLWQSGMLPWDDVQTRLSAATAPTVPAADVLVDMDRHRRCGYPEVVFGPGKSPEAIVAVFQAQQVAGQNSLATRLSPEQLDIVRGAFPQARINATARTAAIRRTGVVHGRVTVVTAGTSDRPIAEEVVETVLWMGCAADLLIDVGVAGPHRLLAHRDRLQKAEAIVVVAGMEGALPSVVAGWVGVPVLAVPTSVGYGANLGGLAALFSMLNSCAANVAVVNIDAGFKAGYLAAMIARQATLTSPTDRPIDRDNA